MGEWCEYCEWREGCIGDESGLIGVTDVSDSRSACGVRGLMDTSSVSDVSGVIVVSGTIRESFESMVRVV